MVVELGCATGFHRDFSDPDFDVGLDAFASRQISTRDRGSGINWRVVKVLFSLPVQDCFFMTCHFHGAEGHGEVPVLLMKCLKTRGVKLSHEGSIYLADIEPVVVLTVHQAGVDELQRKLIKVVERPQ